MRNQTSSETSSDINLRMNFEQFCGIVSNAQELETVDSILDLFTPARIRDFATRLSAEHGCKRTTIVGRVGRMINALRLSPRFRDVNFDWVYEILREFRIENPEELRSRRRTKEVDYDLLSSMIKKMNAERNALKDPSDEELGWRVHDELLIVWMTTLPWFPLCIREARLLGDEPNIFNLPAPNVGTTGIPPWAVVERDNNPRSTFWQFQFSRSETPNGMPANGFVPRRLITLLDKYTTLHRRHLLQGADPKTLFLDRFGGRMTAISLMQRVGILTERYLQKKVTPEAFRAIFGYHWLDEHPGDYQGVAGILWIHPASAKSRFDPNYRSGRQRS